jgi:hypothetical protein
MPRRNRRAEEIAPPSRMLQSDAPGWARFPGFDVRRVTSDKPYRCPGCDLEVRPGMWHLVVVPQDDPDGRRHWHERCWQIELNRSRGRPARS